MSIDLVASFLATAYGQWLPLTTHGLCLAITVVTVVGLTVGAAP